MDNSREIVGRYRLVRELGAGATGRVFLAERIQDFQQMVAIKLLRWTPATGSNHEPSGREHVILRSLEHPNIVAPLDQGRTADGAPFLVLEYLDGTTIDAWCDTHRLTVAERLTLVVQVFSAVSYAHSRLVLHGDIKPANIMVIPSPSRGSAPIVKLLDFGMSLWQQKGQPDAFTAGVTLAYASPEQQRGDPLSVATDVYALGILISRLLAGMSAALSRDDSTSMSACFRGADPTRQQEIAASRSTTPHTLAQLLRGPLDAIVKKATATAPEDRYVSVAAMAEDVNRYMGNMETSVYPLGRLRQALLWMQRHAWLTALTATMFAVIIAGGSLTFWRHHRVVLQERETHTRLLELAHLTDDLSGTLYRSTRSLPGTEQARASLLRAASSARDAVSQENMHDPELSLELARQYVVAAELELAQSNKEARQQAQRSLDHAQVLLKDVSNNQLRSETEEKIKGLQARIATSS